MVSGGPIQIRIGQIRRDLGNVLGLHPDIARRCPLLSKKSQTALWLISCRKTKHATIVRRYALRRAVEVTSEFIAL
jgi:hypothetical protein